MTAFEERVRRGLVEAAAKVTVAPDALARTQARARTLRTRRQAVAGLGAAGAMALGGAAWASRAHRGARVHVGDTSGFVVLVPPSAADLGQVRWAGAVDGPDGGTVQITVGSAPGDPAARALTSQHRLDAGHPLPAPTSDGAALARRAVAVRGVDGVAVQAELAGAGPVWAITWAEGDSTLVELRGGVDEDLPSLLAFADALEAVPVGSVAARLLGPLTDTPSLHTAEEVAAGVGTGGRTFESAVIEGRSWELLDASPGATTSRHAVALTIDGIERTPRAEADPWPPAATTGASRLRGLLDDGRVVEGAAVGVPWDGAPVLVLVAPPARRFTATLEDTSQGTWTASFGGFVGGPGMVAIAR